MNKTEEKPALLDGESEAAGPFRGMQERGGGSVQRDAAAESNGGDEASVNEA